MKRELLRNLIRDIVFQIKNNIHQPRKLVYESLNLGSGSNFDLEIILNKGKDFDNSFLKPFNMEAFWDDETNTLEIFLNIDNKAGNEIFYNLIGELNDTIVHELTHKKQYERGDKIPHRKITRPLTYYTQPHEIEAQIEGFKRKAKLQRRDVKDVMYEYFDKRRKKYNLTDSIIFKIINRLTNE